jgi:hypothetical protein
MRVINYDRVAAGGGVAIDGGGRLVLEGGKDAEILLFELL